MAFGRDLTFGPNADLNIIKWSQAVVKQPGIEGDGFFSDYPSAGHWSSHQIRAYQHGYFSWFKPLMEGRFSWMSLTGLALSTWDFGAGVGSS